MLKYEILYRKIGVRKLIDFIEPTPMLKYEFTFPYESTLHYIKHSDLLTYPTRKDGLFKYIVKPVIITVDNYIQPIGRTKVNISKIKDGITKCKKENSDFKLIPLNSKKINVSKKQLLIYNYGALTYAHRYSVNKLNTYYKWYNLLNTSIDIINNDRSGLHHFITIEVPDVIPNIIDLNKYSSMPMSNTILNHILDSDVFTIMDIWKLLTPDLRNNSLLNKIKNPMNTTLIFIYKDKMVLVNLNILLGLVSEYNIQSELKPITYVKARKVFYIFIKRLLLQVGIKLTEVEHKKEFNLKLHSASDIENDTLAKRIENKRNKNDININDIDITSLTEKIDDDNINLIEDDSDIDIDSLITDDVTVINDIETTYDTLNELLKEDIDTTEALYNKIIELTNIDSISSNESKRLLKILEEQNSKPDPYKTGKTIKEMTTISKEELVLKEDDIKIPDNEVVTDKSMLYKTIETLDKQYLNNIYKKDIISTILSIQNTDTVVMDYNITESESILGNIEEHKITIKPLNGKQSTIKIRLPKIDSDGTYTISGNRYRMRKQRSGLPIKKIDYNKVALTSYYGKLFITKAKFKKDDTSFWLAKQLVKLSNKDGVVKNVTLASSIISDVKLPSLYTTFSRVIKNFTYKDNFYYFGYHDRAKLFNKEYKEIEGNKYVLVGKYKQYPLVMDSDNQFFYYKNKKYIPHIDILDELNIDLNNGPIEFSSIKIFKKEIPVVLLLIYYIGIDTLLKILNVDYTVLPVNKRYILKTGEYVIKFLDNKYIFNRKDKEATMLLGGLVSIQKHIKNINKDNLNSKDNILYLFNLLDYPMLYITEIKMLENSFVDPMTKTVLKEMNEPVNFKGLLFRSNELLITDEFTHNNKISESIIKGYERVAGMIYNQLMSSMRDYENRSVYGVTKVTFDTFGIWKTLTADSTAVLVDDLNPLASLKQTEDVTYAGMLGISSKAISKEIREYHPSEVGVISEGSKDDSSVGLSAYLSSNPKINNIRGLTTKFDYKRDGFTSILGTVNNISPGTTHDVGKRSNFTQIQHAHVVPTVVGKAPQVRTGYEYVLAHRVDNKFAVVAETEGVVTNKTKYNITVKFKDKEEKYRLGKWSSKNESGSSYMHNIVTPLSKGDKVKPNEVITYDETFFELDMFNKKQVIYKSGTILYTAFEENAVTDEDASMLSKKAGSKLISKLYKVKSYILNSNDNILDIVKVGDKVEHKSVMFTTIDNTITSGNVNFDNEALATLQKIKRNNPLAKIRGVVDKIVFYYNDDIENMSESLKQLITESDKRLQLETGKKHITGRVNSEYSIKGKPLLDGEIEMKVYIEYEDDMGTGDKGIFGNQLKTTISSVYDYTIKTEDGKDIDAVFSWKAVLARTVNSPVIIGTTTLLLDDIAEKAVKLYEK